MSEVTGLKTPSSASDNDADDRTAALKARWKTKKPSVKKTAKSAHLNPVPSKHGATSTGN